MHRLDYNVCLIKGYPVEQKRQQVHYRRVERLCSCVAGQKDILAQDGPVDGDYEEVDWADQFEGQVVQAEPVEFVFYIQVGGALESSRSCQCDCYLVFTFNRTPVHLA